MEKFDYFNYSIKLLCGQPFINSFINLIVNQM